MKNDDKFIQALQRMIDKAEYGPLGFAADGEDSCINPDIFREYRKAIEHDEYKAIHHPACPWDKEIMYGTNRASYDGGCFYRCGLKDAKILSATMIRTILERFLEQYQKGIYDNIGGKAIAPLLTPEEQAYIPAERKRLHEEERNKHLNKAKNILSAYDSDEWHNLLADCYDEEVTNIMDDYSLMTFSRDYAKDIVGCPNISYDDFLVMEYRSHSQWRHGFEGFYFGYALPSYFHGTISSQNNKHICFNSLALTGYYMDGERFDDKEGHVWMDAKDFKSFNVGDCVEFQAEIYMYAKSGDDGKKVLDFGLRKPHSIQKIDKYHVPSDEELMKEQMQQIKCEFCLYYDNCNQLYCPFA